KKSKCVDKLRTFYYIDDISHPDRCHGMKSKNNKNDRIDVRVSSDVKQLIEKAAQYRGLSISAFATAVLVENAKQVIEESNTISLSEGDQEIFIQALDRAPGTSLLRAAKRYKSLNE
ncbi:MAG TPA: DUF1778 domain-containing protein, partial [Spirochaetota bacterium]|nr:DUF1778 domain-containing protein [Spirochaetota bacterium]